VLSGERAGALSQRGTMIKRSGADVATALNQAHHDWIVRLAPKPAGRLFCETRQFRFIASNDLAKAANWP